MGKDTFLSHGITSGVHIAYVTKLDSTCCCIYLPTLLAKQLSCAHMHTWLLKVYQVALMPGAAMLEAALSSATLLTHTLVGNEDCEAILANAIMSKAMLMSSKTSMYCVIDQNGHTPTVTLRSQLGHVNVLDHLHGDVISSQGKCFANTLTSECCREAI